MLSRVANSIYWLSRYIERAENVARLIGVNLVINLDLPMSTDLETQWEPLVSITGDQEYFQKHYGAPTSENVIRFHTFDAKYPNSIYSCVTAARENARTIRENISTEMWEQINKFYLMIKKERWEQSALYNPLDFFNEVKKEAYLFEGITNSTLTHGEAWRFIRLGRLLERADNTSRILDVKYFLVLPRLDDVGSPLDNLQWAALLKSVSGLEMYRRQFRHISDDSVVGFLVLNSEFPRAIKYCLIKAGQALQGIMTSHDSTDQNSPLRHFETLDSFFNSFNIDEIFAFGLHEFLDALQMHLNNVGKAIDATFFNPQPLNKNIDDL